MPNTKKTPHGHEHDTTKKGPLADEKQKDIPGKSGKTPDRNENLKSGGSNMGSRGGNMGNR